MARNVRFPWYWHQDSGHRTMTTAEVDAMLASYTLASDGVFRLTSAGTITGGKVIPVKPPARS